MEHRDPVRKHHEHHGIGLNGRLAKVITQGVGTMYCAYLFCLIAFVGLPTAIASPKDFVAWVSSQFIQLVLLPVIIVGQNIAGAAADERAMATYQDAEAVLEKARAIEDHLLEQDKALAATLEHLAK